jgi:hypothetical protein
MPATPTHDLAIKTGEYTDHATGQTKGRWLRVGTVFRHDNGGLSIKLESLPIGMPEWQGWISVFRRDERNGNGASSQFDAPGHEPDTPVFDDDIPF